MSVLDDESIFFRWNWFLIVLIVNFDSKHPSLMRMRWLNLQRAVCGPTFDVLWPLMAESASVLITRVSLTQIKNFMVQTHDHKIIYTVLALKFSIKFRHIQIYITKIQKSHLKTYPSTHTTIKRHVLKFHTTALQYRNILRPRHKT